MPNPPLYPVRVFPSPSCFFFKPACVVCWNKWCGTLLFPRQALLIHSTARYVDLPPKELNRVSLFWTPPEVLCHRTSIDFSTTLGYDDGLFLNFGHTDKDSTPCQKDLLKIRTFPAPTPFLCVLVHLCPKRFYIFATCLYSRVQGVLRNTQSSLSFRRPTT